ncbi:MAG TPA: VOC family protein [Candidatus Acidoferrales bacterium]|nr:VOC family protein [Candidatus Acidoferrales bacterium]
MTARLSRRRFLSATGAALIALPVLRAAEDFPPMLDHILLGIDDLDRGIAFMKERTGVRAAFGGVHPGRGTQNALLRLGTRRYLEIIAPDPKQTSLAAYPELREMREPRLLTWAVHTDDIAAVAKKLTDAGFAIDGPADGSRARPDGKILHWKALRLNDDRSGLLPFFIEWGHDSVHPSVDAPSGCQLVQFAAASSNPEELRAVVGRLGVELEVEPAAKSQLRVRITGARGTAELSS